MVLAARPTRGYRRQPAVGDILDRGHPIAPALVDLFLCNEAGGGQLAGLAGAYRPTSVTPTWTQGPLGSALSLDGQWNGTRYWTVKTTGPILGTVHAWSIWAWASTTAQNVAGGTPVYAERASTGSDILKLDAVDQSSPNSAFITYRNDAGTLAQVRGTAHINDGKLHFVVATCDGTTLRLYVDGLLDASGSYPGGNFTNAGLQCQIGHAPTASSGQPETWSGQIAQLGLATRALSAVEIQALYAAPQSLVLHRPLVRTWAVLALAAPPDHATGTDSLGQLQAVGTGRVTLRATGSASLAQPDAHGTGLVTELAQGTASLAQLQVHGSGRVTDRSAGGARLDQLQAVGTARGASPDHATGTGSLGQLQAVGTGRVTEHARGTDSLGQLQASGHATLTDRATGSPSLAQLGASGSAVLRVQAQGQCALFAVGRPLVLAASGYASNPAPKQRGPTRMQRVGLGRTGLRARPVRIIG